MYQPLTAPKLVPGQKSAAPTTTKSPLGAGLSFNAGGGLMVPSKLTGSVAEVPGTRNPGSQITGPVKSTTVKSNGDTTTQYHPPAAPAPAPAPTVASQSSPVDTNTGRTAVIQTGPTNTGLYGAATGGVAGGNPLATGFPGLVGGLLNTNKDYAGFAGGAAGALEGNARSYPAEYYTRAAYNYGAGNIPIGQKAQDIADKYSQQIADVGALGAQGKVGLLTSGAMNPVALGRAGVVQQNAAEQQQAIAAAESAALQGTAQGLQGQSQAANAANAAAGQSYTGLGLTQSAFQRAADIAQAQQGLQQGAYGTAIGAAAPSGTYPFVFNPLTGQYTQSTGSGGGGGVILSPQQVAQQLNTGAMTSEQARQALSYLGPTAQTQLMSAMAAVNPQFNWAQAEALGTTQGQVAPLLNQAQNSLAILNSVISNTPWYQKFGVPALNSLTNMLASYGVGTGSEGKKQGAISEARTQVANALGVMTNTTPTAWTAMVEGWFPNNATPAQIAAGIENFNSFAGNRQGIFGTPGNVQPFSAGGGSAAPTNYSW